MRPFTSTITIEDALGRIGAAAVPIKTFEEVALDAADGRVLASDVVASHDVPPFDRSAMDGYAVRAFDTQGAAPNAPRKLRLAGVVYTGDAPVAAVGAGTCIEIATGAPLPEGADAVVKVEDTQRDGNTVLVMRQAEPGQHVSPHGGDIIRGTAVLRAGDLLSPARVGALAALGMARVPVYARPRVALVSTGNEIVPPGTPLEPGQIHDVNRFTLAAVVRRHGGEPVTLDVAADTLGDLAAAVDRASDCDLLVFSGGSSVGERDLVIDVLRARGEVLFHGIAVKPGKPTAFGRIGRTLVFGMPGNPTSCLSNAIVLLVPLLRRLARLPAHEPRVIALPLAHRIASTPSRHQFYMVAIEEGRAVPAFKGSGAITSMSRADGYIEVPVGIDTVDAGTIVDVTLF
jgi:molybdenum cofactor synthesis domain-containing protein